MKMPARPLFGGATGMKRRHPFPWRNDSKLQFLEGSRGCRRNIPPGVDARRTQSALKAQPSQRGIVVKLKREQLPGQLIEAFLAAIGGVNERGDIHRQLAQC